MAESLGEIQKGDIPQRTFKYWFRELDASGQEEIIKLMFDRNLVEVGIKYLPTDLTEFHIPDLSGGSFNEKARMRGRITRDYISLIKFMGTLNEATHISVDARYLGRLELVYIEKLYNERPIWCEDEEDIIKVSYNSLISDSYYGCKTDIFAVVLTLAQVLPSMENLENVNFEYTLFDRGRVQLEPLWMLSNLLYAHTSVCNQKNACKNVGPAIVPKILNAGFSMEGRVHKVRPKYQLGEKTYDFADS